MMSPSPMALPATDVPPPRPTTFQPLGPFALAALSLLDPESDTYTFDVISVYEAILDRSCYPEGYYTLALAAASASWVQLFESPYKLLVCEILRDCVVVETSQDFANKELIRRCE